MSRLTIPTICKALLAVGFFVSPGCDDVTGPHTAFATVVAGSSWDVATDSAPPPDALLAPQALVLYQGGTAAKDSVTLPDSADLSLAVRAFKNGVATNGYSTVTWLNYTTGVLTVDSTASKKQRALLHRRATFDPGWLVVVSKIAGVQVRDSVYVRDAANPAPPPIDTVPPVDTTPPPPADTTNFTALSVVGPASCVVGDTVAFAATGTRLNHLLAVGGGS